MDTVLLLQNAMDVGEALLKSGAEVYRVEDSVDRVLRAYGAQRVDVFTIPSLIVASVQMAGERQVTQTRRILRTATDFTALTRLNALCRDICRETPAPEEIGRRLEEIVAAKPYYRGVLLAAYVLVAFSFACFFGGSWLDSLASGAVGGMLFWVVRGLRGLKVGEVFALLGGAATAAAGALLLAGMGLGVQLDKVVIGNIMLLIPGLELTNGMRDLFSGDVLAGLLHIGEAIFLAMVIALGAAYILSLGGVA